MIVRATWTKTLQNRQRLLEIPLFPIADSPLCPVRTLRLILQKRGKKHFLLFGTNKDVAFTYSQFHTKFRKLLEKAGYCPKAFSSHSMRHGGVNWAHRCGVPESLIQVHGDCYKRYLQFPIEVRAVVSLKMTQAIQKEGW